MEVLGGRAVVIVDAGEAAALSRQLVEAIRLGYVARGRTPPRLLLDLAEGVSRAAAGPRPPGAAPPPPWPLGMAPLTVAEAARLAAVSRSFITRGCRARWFEADRGRGGSWIIDPLSFAAWLAARDRARAGRAA